MNFYCVVFRKHTVRGTTSTLKAALSELGSRWHQIELWVIPDHAAKASGAVVGGDCGAYAGLSERQQNLSTGSPKQNQDQFVADQYTASPVLSEFTADAIVRVPGVVMEGSLVSEVARCSAETTDRSEVVASSLSEQVWVRMDRTSRKLDSYLRNGGWAWMYDRDTGNQVLGVTRCGR